MKVFLYIISILFINSLSAQNWLPFPQNVRNVYGSINDFDNRGNVNFLKCDSLIQSGSLQVYLINSKTNKPIYPFCDDTTFNTSVYDAYRLPESFYISNDSCYILQRGLKIYFDIHAAVNSTFACYDTNKVSCIGYSYDTLFMNVMDSVRTYKFTFYNNEYIFELSKNHGFKRFYNLNLLKAPMNGTELPYGLLGFDETNPIGYVPPSASIYYNLHIGDVIMWKEKDYNNNSPAPFPMGGYVYNYMRDSIVQISNYNDSIVYSLMSKKLDYNNVITTYNDVMKVSKVFVRQMTDYYNSLLFYHPTPLTNLAEELYTQDYYDVKDTINYELGYEIMNYYIIDTSNCTFGQLTDQSYFTFRFRKDVGLYRIGVSSPFLFEETYKVQIGTIINGIATGTTSLTLLKANEITSIDDVLMYPNPTNNKLYFSETVNLIQIISLTGDVLLNQTKTNFVDVAGLAKGIYIVRINKGNVLITNKIIVN